mmetsp:Transcript_3789/g.9032  ORF Transcript_3789/g.9032 Transcript_3789/m.9032 type:complete len:333 (+) Transcript_3789:151-1149(+)
MTSETDEKQARRDSFAAQKEIIMTKTKQFAEQFEKLAKPAMEFVIVLLPILIQVGKKVNATWKKLDDHVIKSIIGFAFCFFGGMYPTLFAGVQAAEQGGRELLIESIKDLSEEATRILNESKKDDDAKDTPDSDDLPEYAKHKTLFVLKKMNPQKVNTALQNLYSVWFAVISVLVVQFARTIQTAKSISEFLAKPANAYAKPVVVAMLPPEYQQWTPILIKWATHTVGISLAWTFTSIRVAFASSLQGGMMMARSGLVALKKRNIDVEGMVTNPKHKELVDDYASYVFAGLGFLFQLYFRLTPPFPLNIILFPFRIAEWALRYGVMKMSTIV